MVDALQSRLSGLGLSGGWGHCVIFFGKKDCLRLQCLFPSSCVDVYGKVRWLVVAGVSLQWTRISLSGEGRQKYSQSVHGAETVQNHPRWQLPCIVVNYLDVHAFLPPFGFFLNLYALSCISTSSLPFPEQPCSRSEYVVSFVQAAINASVFFLCVTHAQSTSTLYFTADSDTD